MYTLDDADAIDLSRCCYGDLKETPYALAVLPWGATEPHNLHLPYLTDALIAQQLGIEAAARLWRKRGVRVMVLPPITLGSQNPGQWNKPFCIHTRYETQRAILGDCVASLHRQGMRRLVLLNGHGGNSFRNMVRDLAFEYPDFTIAVANTFDIIPQEGYFEKRDDHAGEMESSLMLHYYPELVRSSYAGNGTAHPFAAQRLNDHTAWLPRQWDRVSEDTGIGDPHKASAEKGARYAEAILLRLESLFEEMATLEDLYTSETATTR
ncbi:MAG: creatininase family protein [Alistipes sp.]|nr:creatininase family protein [Alistipes sp.]